MASVKLCILMDCTASMGEWIQAAKDQVRDIVRGISTPNARVAFVGYRDYDDFLRSIVVDFTNVDNMLRQIQDIQADGGDDAAEDVAGGLRRVQMLDWSEADVRNIVHIADAPPHGVEYHAVYVSDRYPEGDPDGYSPKQILRELSQTGMDYTFIKTNETTNKMIEVFYEAYVGPGTFKVEDLYTQDDRLPPAVRRRHTTELLTPILMRTMESSIERWVATQPPDTASQDPQVV